jgi:transcriptional regulator with XRE-family HTH domain
VTPEDRISLGRWLRARRDELGLSCGDMARRIGVHNTHVYAIERGSYPPSLVLLDRWRFFGIDLLGRIGVNP